MRLSNDLHFTLLSKYVTQISTITTLLYNSAGMFCLVECCFIAKHSLRKFSDLLNNIEGVIIIRQNKLMRWYGYAKDLLITLMVGTHYKAGTVYTAVYLCTYCIFSSYAFFFAIGNMQLVCVNTDILLVEIAWCSCGVMSSLIYSSTRLFLYLFWGYTYTYFFCIFKLGSYECFLSCHEKLPVLEICANPFVPVLKCSSLPFCSRGMDDQYQGVNSWRMLWGNF